MTRTAFLDRDGTINRERSFIATEAELEVLPGVVEALRRLAEADCRIVVVTNQSGIARGLYTESDLSRIHAELHERLERLPLAYLHCPHHPDSDNAYGGHCECRKPKSGLLHQARELLGADFSGGLLVGDSARDLLMGRELELRTVHVHSGKDPVQEREAMDREGYTPDHTAKDLAAAIAWYLETPQSTESGI